MSLSPKDVIIEGSFNCNQFGAGGSEAQIIVEGGTVVAVSGSVTNHSANDAAYAVEIGMAETDAEIDFDTDASAFTTGVFNGLETRTQQNGTVTSHLLR